MNIQEALSNLDQVCAEFKGTRIDHMALQQSMRVVTDASKPAPALEGSEPDKTEPDGNN